MRKNPLVKEKLRSLRPSARSNKDNIAPLRHGKQQSKANSYDCPPGVTRMDPVLLENRAVLRFLHRQPVLCIESGRLRLLER